MKLLFGVGGENFVLKMLNQKGPKMDQKWGFSQVFFFVEKAVHKPLTLEQLKGLKLIQMILSDSFLVELEEVG